MSEQLKQLRDQIDAIDDQLLQLVSRRAGLAQQVGKIKKSGIIYRPEREAQILARMREHNPGPISNEHIQQLFTEIMSLCRALEKPMSVAFLGPSGTFSEEAALKRFGNAISEVPCDSIDDVFRAVLEERGDDMAFFEERIEKGVIARLQGIVDSEFLRMDYTEAIGILERAKETFDYPVKWGMDLQSEHERYVSEKHAGRPVILMNYPKEIKAFYMRLNDDGKTVAAMDVLAPGIGEIIGGSQREERLDVLDARIRQFGLDPAHYGWYRDFRRYGTVPHAGFGLGFERLVVYVCGLANIRDAIPFPRAPGSAEF